MRRRRAALGALLIAVAHPVLADFERGLEAFRSRHYAEAHKAWLEPATAGERRSQYGLGVLSNEGKGVPRDYAAAAMWFRRAAEQGLPEAQMELGFMRAIGRGPVLQDPVMAYVWFALAAHAGWPEAATYRDAVDKRLLPEERETANQRISELSIELELQ